MDRPNSRIIGLSLLDVVLCPGPVGAIGVGEGKVGFRVEIGFRGWVDPKN